MDIQWSLVLFTAIASCGTWVSVGVAVDELRGLTQRTNLVASVLALVLAVVGGIASVTHLSHPDRIMAVLSHPTAGIFLEALLIGLFIAAVAVYVILLKRDASAGARKAVAVLAAVIGIVFSFASGYSYMMEARTTWNTITLPLGYLGFGAASGLSLYLLLVACKKESAEAVKLAGLETVIGGVLALRFGLRLRVRRGDGRCRGHLLGGPRVRRPRAPRVRMAGAQQARVGRDHGDRRVRRRHHRINRVPRRHVDGGHRGGQLLRHRPVDDADGEGAVQRACGGRPPTGPLDQAIRNPPSPHAYGSIGRQRNR